jgi:hypothetical protein
MRLRASNADIGSVRSSTMSWPSAAMDLDGHISGPITDNLGIRVAGFHNTSEGYTTNPNRLNHHDFIADLQQQVCTPSGASAVFALDDCKADLFNSGTVGAK